MASAAVVVAVFVEAVFVAGLAVLTVSAAFNKSETFKSFDLITKFPF